MTIAATPNIRDGCFMVGGKVVFTGVPHNVVLSPASYGSAFLGATSISPISRHVFTLGVLQGYRFLSLFRFKIWWMIPRVGESGCEIPIETQFLLLEVRQDSALHYEISSEPAPGHTFYVLLLPTLDRQFRTSLQGNASNELQFCAESGDAHVETSQVLEAVFINFGDNPFELIKNSIKILEKHKGTFSRIKNKKIPQHLDWFGWCTWNAFYTNVSPQGILDGLQSLFESGCSPKFLIIDDGWQETSVHDFQRDGEPPIAGMHFAAQLVDIKENAKFRISCFNTACMNLHDLIDVIKETYDLKLVYMWHALVGYWGGVHPLSEAMKKYNPKFSYPIQSPGNVGNIRDIAMDCLEKYGIGTLDPKRVYDFYNDFHTYLASIGIDGVKVDVQNLIETLGSGHGGRVTLTRQYQGALELSISRNFRQNNIISCMSHNTDSIYSSRNTATSRASEDYMPFVPTTHTLHIASVAFNSLLLGEIVVPDWDMFQTKHDTAEFHAAARAIGGCAVYVSDKPRCHDFQILKRLVLPDGSVLRARCAGRPTRDCLFTDPVMDGKSLLKIWNLNKVRGIIGVFNCQGVGTWPLMKKVKEMPITISGHVSLSDVEFLEEVAGKNWTGGCAVYEFHTGSLTTLPNKGNFEVSLQTLTCAIYTISPIQVYCGNIHFAPLGLLDMYNSGGAIEGMNCNTKDPSGCRIRIKGQGCGRFGVYSSSKPKCCMVDMEEEEEEFIYSHEDGLLTFELHGESNMRDIEFIY